MDLDKLGVCELFADLYCLKYFIFTAQKPQNTAQKMKFSIKDFFSKCDKIGHKIGHIYWRNLKGARVVNLKSDFMD